METLKCCEVYDPDEDRWTDGAPLQIARSGSRVVALGAHHLIAAGGCDDVFGRAETQPTVELYHAAAGHWALLEAKLRYPRTTAAVVPIDSRRLLIVGGAPSLSSAETYRVVLPEDVDALGHEALEQAKQEKEIADMPDGRMGCQAAVLHLPRPDCTFPLATHACAVIVGGERCDEGGGDWPRVRQFANVPAFDVVAGTWREDQVVPPMAAPRTAVALCVGLGHVAPQPPRPAKRERSASFDTTATSASG